METSNISNIGKMFVQGQTTGVKGNSQEEELEVAFNEVMSQMQACVGDGLMSGDDAMNMGLESVPTSSKVETDYDRHGSRGVKIQERSKADAVDNERITEKTDAFAEDVKNVLKEELGVSEEQIEEAMKVLGLSFSDLLNPNQLAAMVAELTGAKDMGALLCSEEFMNILHAVGELGEELLSELGISSEQLSQMIAEMENVTETNANDQLLQGENVAQSEVIQEASGASKVAEIADDTMAEIVDDTMAEITATGSAEETDGELVVNEKVTADEQDGDSEVFAAGDGEKVVQTIENKNETTFGQQQSENSGTQSRNDMTGIVDQSLTEQVYAQAQENISGENSQVDISNIIKQIVEFSRVTLSNTATTMEMQLNPENLGKIYLELTSKDGVVSAHITAQNEAAKEALESQLVEFKLNLNQAGVKVDAVEVTVGSHEFEKNLEQNASQQERQAEEQEKATKQTRHINLNDLDELSGIMTEEESLVAQMMAEQGNSVDFTA